MEAWLQTKSGERFHINGNCSIGRLPENQIVLDDVRVSRRHALVHAHGSSGQWLVDFGSSNGVLLNGRRIRDPIQLKDRDCIEISGHSFIFREQRRAQKSSPKPDVTTERVAGKHTATGHGIIVLTSKGEVQCISELAQQWLKSYFPSAPATGSLPKELQHWIERQNPAAKQVASIPVFPETLFVPQENRRLVVRIAENTSEQRILLLTEEQPVFTPALLETLGLTHRESEVLRWVAEGKSNPEIGIILDLSPRTVSKHLENIFQKLGVESRTAALLYVVETLGKTAA
jgi:DNA-binding CsgD family transcriptional regulator